MRSRAASLAIITIWKRKLIGKLTVFIRLNASSILAASVLTSIRPLLSIVSTLDGRLEEKIKIPSL